MRRLAVLALLLVGIALSRVGNATPDSSAWEPTCAADSHAGVRWIRTAAMRERASLDRWCAGVGLPARIEGRRSVNGSSGPLVVVSWNTHIGGGDIDAFVGDLRSGKLTGAPVSDFVLLLQEVYRSGPDVPGRVGVSWASAERPVARKRDRVDVTAAAARLGLWGIYVPSMRNGRPGATREDRGNAILATGPLSDVTAIELPLESQRRVAISAAVTIGGRPLHVVCTHFTNMVMHHLWLLSESGRLRQARSLAQHLPGGGPLVVGGDFNAWFGFRDAAYRELAQTLSPAASVDRRATFGPLRLDHLLFRVPPEWRAGVKRADDKYGSDHYPLIATIDAR
jgi:endonuclease/exonuclease/phosphatase family metal-dependent hydrolase